MPNVFDTIRTFNAGRDPERLAMKYANLRSNAFVFLRGTCHLFYDRLPSDALFAKAPRAGCAATRTWRTSAATRATTGSCIST
jgi:uncharacterized protein (DUF2252 family)